MCLIFNTTEGILVCRLTGDVCVVLWESIVPKSEDVLRVNTDDPNIAAVAHVKYSHFSVK